MPYEDERIVLAAKACEFEKETGVTLENHSEVDYEELFTSWIGGGQ